MSRTVGEGGIESHDWFLNTVELTKFVEIENGFHECTMLKSSILLMHFKIKPILILKKKNIAFLKVIKNKILSHRCGKTVWWFYDLK